MLDELGLKAPKPQQETPPDITIEAPNSDTLLKIIKNELITADQRKKDKAARAQAHWGNGKIMNLEVVPQRKDDIAAK